MRVLVIGCGSWGTALSILLARNGHQVFLFGRSAEEIETLQTRRENFRYLQGFIVPEGCEFGLIGRDPVPETDFATLAVPSSAVRNVVSSIRTGQPIVLASKGLEAASHQLLSQTVEEALPGAIVGALSGPNLAVEIARGVPTVAVSAFRQLEAAEMVRNAYMSRTFRVYTSDDLVGVELAGALKNVLAIGAGMSDGLGYGDNTKGALLARGLHEMVEIGLSMGARIETFMGIAGVGDLFATASSKLSRNYRVGYALGQGQQLAAILDEIGQVAEGVPTSEAVTVMSRLRNLQTPIFEAIDNVLRGRVSPSTAVNLLMERIPRSEVPLRQMETTT